MKLYYKAYTDFNNFIPISSDELEMALYAFKEQAPVTFRHGATNRIEKILPDYHRIMGWRDGYKLTPDDAADIEKSGAEKLHLEQFATANRRVSFFIEQKTPHLIGSGAEVPEPKYIGEVSALAVSKSI